MALLERGAGFLLFLVGLGMGRFSASFLPSLFTVPAVAAFAAVAAATEALAWAQAQASASEAAMQAGSSFFIGRGLGNRRALCASGQRGFGAAG